MKVRQREPQQSGALAPFWQMDRIRDEINRIFEDPLSIMKPGRSFFEG